MGAATVASILTDVRTHTAHDSDTQVTDTQLTAQVDTEYKNLRRQLATIAPELFVTTTTPTVAAGASTIAKPSDYERLWLLERQTGSGLYYPVECVAPLNARASSVLNVTENVSTLDLYPTSLAPGSYRLSYLAGVTAGYTTVAGIPDGYEHVIVMRVCAMVARRHEEDPTHFLREADSLMKDIKRDLCRRYGAHGRSILNVTRW